MAIPLFILAGELINEGRITDRLISLANVLFGWMPGGLAQVNMIRSSGVKPFSIRGGYALHPVAVKTGQA